MSCKQNITFKFQYRTMHKNPICMKKTSETEMETLLPLSAISSTTSRACTSITTSAPRVMRCCLVSLPRTKATTSFSCSWSRSQKSRSPWGPPLMASWTSRVQYTWEAQRTTWPGHSFTHSVRGEMMYAWKGILKLVLYIK